MLSFKPQLLNQRGVGLLQVMIMSGLIGIMGVAFVQLTDQQNKTLETSKIAFEIAQFTDQVRVGLSEPQACLATFGGQPYASTFNVTTLRKTYVEPSTQNKITVPLASVGDEIAPNIKLLEIKMKNVDPTNQKGFVELTVERKGGTIVKREIQIVALDPTSSGQITNCFTSGTSVEDPAILCSSLGGVWNTTEHRCNGIVAIDPNPVFCQKYSRRQITQDSTGRLKIVCQPCGTPVAKFDHWTCGHYPGKSSWSNLCHYRMVCGNSRNDLMRPAQWDGKKGPIDASGGDTSSRSNCLSDRRRCDFEPAGMAENQVNP